MARTATSVVLNNAYTREITASGKIASAYNIPTFQSPDTLGTHYSFTLDFPGTTKVGGGSAGTIEFWLYVSNSLYAFSAQLVGNATFTGTNFPGIYLQGTGQTINWQKGQTGGNLFGVSHTVAANTWYHIAITTDGSDNWYWWVDGVYKGSGTSTASFTTIDFGKNFDSGNVDTRFDEIRISNTQRYTSGNNFTAPTTAFSNDANTIALFHGDSATETDDTAEQHNGSASLSSAFSQTAAGLLVQVDEYVHVGYWLAEYTEEIPNRFGSASLSASFTQTAAAINEKTASATLTSAATISAIGGIQHDGASALSSAATLSVSAGILQVGASALSATCSVSASAVLTFNATSSLNSAATETAAAAMTFAGAADLLWQGFVLGYPGVERNASAALSTTATLSATATGLQFGEAALTSAATVTAQGLNTKTASSNLSSSASMSVSAEIFDISSANFVSNFSMVTVGSVLFGGSSAALAGAFTVTANGEVVIDEVPERIIKVKSETRIFDLWPDSRIINTKNETRINIVLPQNRTILVPEESRIVKEP